MPAADATGALPLRVWVRPRAGLNASRSARPLRGRPADRARLRHATGLCKPSAEERHLPQSSVASEANMKDELANLDATEQAELVRRKEVSPLELVDAAITRIEKVNPQ